MYNKLHVLSNRMRNEEALLGGQLTPELLKKALDEGRATCIEEDGEIVAFGAHWDRGTSLELGSLWVATTHRGKRLGSFIFDTLVHKPRNEVPLFLITSAPQVIHLAARNGFKEATRESWDARIPFSASCGLCDRILEPARQQCPYRAMRDECQLFLTP